MKKLLLHLGLLIAMIVCIIVDILNKNTTGLMFGIVAAICWFVLSIGDIIKLKHN